ncbi:hypothetical protein [Thermococcus nautili]|uniref:Uncharacterized protein n=1 Tax=Thermococcus nautili TaxID=195522 RepID=W8NR34_9EURY|nr:hypothetical protein [Thermococcus nautili]AHL21673.1 hypothetical protein BD01_0041 [Thermococcus nautili]
MRRSTKVLIVSGVTIAGFFALAPALPLYSLLVRRYGASAVDTTTVVLGLIGLITLVVGVTLRKFESLPRNVALYETAGFLMLGTFGVAWINALNGLKNTVEKVVVSVLFFVAYVVFMELLKRRLNPDRYRRMWKTIVVFRKR